MVYGWFPAKVNDLASAGRLSRESQIIDPRRYRLERRVCVESTQHHRPAVQIAPH